ncbi:S1 RNA-binding domain-containing protein [Labilithrix luteola]|uniref:S1 RNA-binding domain-containing protein n=1 Tax=Labilithrix luteola TaxID=1391654 RepID=UPI0011BA9744|nr:S1 RNA-binding domain-containing protein [Labilithrix luteola]
MNENERVTATITGVHSYGLDIEVDGQVGFVDCIELNWSNTAQPTDFSVGDRVPVRIYAVTPDRFYASIKRATPDPWADPSRFAVGTRHVGTVRAVVEYGSTVEMPLGVLAVILAADYGAQFEVGLQLEVEVVYVDPRIRKLDVKPVS